MGSLDDVRLYNRALGSTGVAALYQVLPRLNVLIAEVRERGLGDTRTRNERCVLKRSSHLGWKLRWDSHAFAADSSSRPRAYPLKSAGGVQRPR
jgi:hypothetical protein